MPGGTESSSGLRAAPAPLNSVGHDFAPTLSADGKTMIFASRRGDAEYADLYVTNFRDGRWSDPQALDQLNSPFIDETPFLVPDGSMLFFASNRDGSVESRDEQGRLRVSMDLYVSRHSASGWTAPQRLAGEVNSELTERSPALDQQSGILYFSRQPIGDISATQIFQARYQDGAFVDVRALPAPVNVGATDASFVPAPGKHGFYFTSRRSGGLGYDDIYFVSFEDGRFGQPINLGPGINSAERDLALAVGGDWIIVCSTRSGGPGGVDLFLERVAALLELQIEVRDRQSRAPLPGEVESSIDGQAFQRAATDAQGRLDLQLDSGARAIRLRISRRGYLPYEQDFVLNPAENSLHSESGSQIPRQTLGVAETSRHLLAELLPIQTAATFDLRAIQFNYNEATLRSDSAASLEQLDRFLRENPELRLEVVGHTDMHGDPDYNQQLSERRAAAVIEELKRRGIQGARLQGRGAGMSQPLSRENSDAADERNRRTEFRVLSASAGH